MSDRRIHYDPPLRNSIHCQWCTGEIQAVARNQQYLGIAGLNDYEWTHVDSGLADCRIVRQARPFDGWHATRRIEAAQRERWREQDEAEESGGDAVPNLLAHFDAIDAIDLDAEPTDPGCPWCGDPHDPDQPNLHARCRQIPDAETRRDGRDD